MNESIKKRIAYGGSLGSALYPALEHIRWRAGRRGHCSGEERGKGMRSYVVLKLGARQDSVFRGGIPVAWFVSRMLDMAQTNDLMYAYGAICETSSHNR